MTSAIGIAEPATTAASGAEPPLAWFSSQEFGRVPVRSSMTIGRSKNCDVVIADARISRRHAVIHCNVGAGEYWISDLGGVNGIHVNERRVQHTTRLWHGDDVRILDFRFQLHAPKAPRKPVELSESSSGTMLDCRVVSQWLMVADIVDGTGWASQMAIRELPFRLDGWLSECRGIIDGSKGQISNYVGDGFLAGWVAGPGVVDRVEAAIQDLRRLQCCSEMRFRFVVHYGEVTVSGVGAAGQESVLGPEVNYVFRMEKVAANSGNDVLISQSAAEQLGRGLQLFKTARMPVPSFGSGHEFFTIGSNGDGGREL